MLCDFAHMILSSRSSGIRNSAQVHRTNHAFGEECQEQKLHYFYKILTWTAKDTCLDA